MVRKIFVDSRFRDSGTHANFQFTLSAPVLHPKCRAYLDNIHIPNLFYTIHGNAKHIYIVEFFDLTDPHTGITAMKSRKRKISLNEGHYDLQTLGVELERALDANSFFPGVNDSYTVSSDPSTGKLTVGMVGTTNNMSATIWSMQYLLDNRQLWVDANSPQVGTVGNHDDCYHALGLL